jgi:hypothetical protein
MTAEQKQQLVYLLGLFFAEAKFGTRDFLNKDFIASYLKTELLKIGHWKNRPRNPKPKIISSIMLAKQFVPPPPKPEENCPF